MWIQTLNNVEFDYSNPDSMHIIFEDISAALQNSSRFNGFVDLSIAQHSIWVAAFVAHNFGTLVAPYDNKEDLLCYIALRALLHDAHEAYIGDIVSPLKRYIKHETGSDCLDDLCEVIDQKIFSTLIPERFATAFELVSKLDSAFYPRIMYALKAADVLAFMYERVRFMPRNTNVDVGPPSAYANAFQSTNIIIPSMASNDVFDKVYTGLSVHGCVDVLLDYVAPDQEISFSDIFSYDRNP